MTDAMNDKALTVKAQLDSTDDVTGHGSPIETASDEALAGVQRRPVMALPEDDVQGHRVAAVVAAEDDDDVEGHRVAAVVAAEDDDDVEGHRSFL